MFRLAGLDFVFRINPRALLGARFFQPFRLNGGGCFKIEIWIMFESHTLQSTSFAPTFTGMIFINSTGNSPGVLHVTVSEAVDRNLTGNSASRSFAEELLALLESAPPGTQLADRGCIRVLDVGTGKALIPIEICARRRDIRFMVVDRASRALQTARRNVEQAGHAGAIRVVKAQANSLPFANASFDAVISSSLLHHVSNSLGALSEMRRVLRPDGLLVVRDTLEGSDTGQNARILSGNNRNSHQAQRAFQSTFHALLNIDEARDLARAAGFPATSVRQAGPRHWVLAYWP